MTKRRAQLSRRARWIAVAVVVAFVAALAGWLVAPKIARGRLESELRRRLGPAATFGRLEVGAGGLTLADVDTGVLGRGLALRVERVRIAGFPPFLAWRSEGAIRGVELDGARLLVRLPASGPAPATDSPNESTEPADAAEAAGAVAPAEPAEPAERDGRAQARSSRGVEQRTDDAAAPLPDTRTPALDRAQGLLLRATRRLAEDATVRATGATVVAIDPEGRPRVLVSGLDVELTRLEGERLRTSGSGGTAEGSVGWNLELEPRSLRAVGAAEVVDLPLAVVLPALPKAPWHDPLATRLDGKLELSADPTRDTDVAFEGSLRVRELAVEAAELHEDPLSGLGLRIAGEGAWIPDERRLVLRDSRAALTESPVEVHLAGALQFLDDRIQLDAEASLPESPCRQVLAAIPAPILAGLEGFDWSGTLQGRVELRLDSADPDAARLHFAVDDQCRFVRVPEQARADRLRGPFLHVVRGGDGVVHERLVGPGAPGWVPLERISPFLVHAVLAHEDAAFFRHRGFAPWAIETALQSNLRAGRFAYGASTISMQLAKNLFLQRDKTVARKVREVLLTWWLESALGKREILALYLNVIEYGPNVYGIEQGAAHYFGRRPDELSPAESAFLATALPAPSSYHRQFVAGKLGPGTRQQMRFLIERMHQRERIDAAARDYGLGELDSFAFRHGAEQPAQRVVIGSAAPL